MEVPMQDYNLFLKEDKKDACLVSRFQKPEIKKPGATITLLSLIRKMLRVCMIKKKLTNSNPSFYYLKLPAEVGEAQLNTSLH